ncbi:MAG: methyl-accepting chemotaxis sensory transducer, partial [uncultured bacterium]
MLMPLGAANRDPIAGFFPSWSSALSSSLATLHRLAGATEQEFLQIGSQLQEIYQHSLALSQTAHQLVETASGDRLQTLIDRLREIVQEMNTYLDQARTQNLTSYTTLANVSESLKKVGEPLVGVRRMCKHLYILEVSIKIESAHLGDMGSEFVNLAMDIKQLSQQTKEKVAAIEDHRQHLQTIIARNRTELVEAREAQDAEAEATLSRTA